MKKVLVHPTLFTSVYDCESAKHAASVVRGLVTWATDLLQEESTYAITQYTQDVLIRNKYIPDMDVLSQLHIRYPDVSWTPGLVFNATNRLFYLPFARSNLLNDEIISDWQEISVDPSFIQATLPPVFSHAEKRDAAVLAREKELLEEAFDWVVAIIDPEEKNKSIEVRVEGKAGVNGSNGVFHEIVIHDTLRYLTNPGGVLAKEDRLYAQVRRHVTGQNALCIGGDGRQHDEANLCRTLGLNQAPFLSHFRKGPGENISRAKQRLKSGKYQLYIHYTSFGSHSPANLKDFCPPDCHYIPVNGTPTINAIAEAIAQALNIPID